MKLHLMAKSFATYGAMQISFHLSSVHLLSNHGITLSDFFGIFGLKSWRDSKFEVFETWFRYCAFGPKPPIGL